MKFSKWLHKEMGSQGYNYRQLWISVIKNKKIARAQIGRMVRGEIKNPGIRTINLIVKPLGFMVCIKNKKTGETIEI